MVRPDTTDSLRYFKDQHHERPSRPRLDSQGCRQTAPQCGFSHQVTQILNHLGVDYRDVNVLDDMGIREGIKVFSNWPTIPQLYVKGEFIGGCDIIREMFQEGELQQVLTDKGIAFDKATMTA
jgi:monothiol glutaredoxin